MSKNRKQFTKIARIKRFFEQTNETNRTTDWKTRESRGLRIIIRKMEIVAVTLNYDATNKQSFETSRRLRRNKPEVSRQRIINQPNKDRIKYVRVIRNSTICLGNQAKYQRKTLSPGRGRPPSSLKRRGISPRCAFTTNLRGACLSVKVSSYANYVPLYILRARRKGGALRLHFQRRREESSRSFGAAFLFRNRFSAGKQIKLRCINISITVWNVRYINLVRVRREGRRWRSNTHNT